MLVRCKDCGRTKKSVCSSYSIPSIRLSRLVISKRLGNFEISFLISTGSHGGASYDKTSTVKMLTHFVRVQSILANKWSRSDNRKHNTNVSIIMDLGLIIIQTLLQALPLYCHCLLLTRWGLATHAYMMNWAIFRPNNVLYPRPTKLEGGYTGFTLSVCPSVCL